MNFCVCIKQVADVTAPMQVRDGHLAFDGTRVVLNAYDASAVEEALVLTEKHGGEVEVVLIGPERAAETIRKALAMGAARGAHLVVPDLLAALESGALAHAYLDVFQPEPLPASDPLWAHPGVTLTPHIAALTEPRTAVPKIVENVERVRRGETPLHLVDFQAGY